MAIYRDRPCPICNGKGFITIIGENSIGCSSCEECHHTGMVLTAITNNERMNELTSPEDKLRFIRGFQQWSKYLGTLFDVVDLDTDEGLLLWLNKLSDDSDNLIFGSEE